VNCRKARATPVRGQLCPRPRTRRQLPRTGLWPLAGRTTTVGTGVGAGTGVGGGTARSKPVEISPRLSRPPRPLTLRRPPTVDRRLSSPGLFRGRLWLTRPRRQRLVIRVAVIGRVPSTVSVWYPSPLYRRPFSFASWFWAYDADGICNPGALSCAAP